MGGAAADQRQANGDRAAIQQQHVRPRTHRTGRVAEPVAGEGSGLRFRGERAAALPFPALGFEVEERLDGSVQILARLEAAQLD
jgi:hypothetical protein